MRHRWRRPRGRAAARHLARRQPLASVLAARRVVLAVEFYGAVAALLGGASAVRRRRRRLLARRARAARVVRVGPLAALGVDRQKGTNPLINQCFNQIFNCLFLSSTIFLNLFN